MRDPMDEFLRVSDWIEERMRHQARFHTFEVLPLPSVQRLPCPPITW